MIVNNGNSICFKNSNKFTLKNKNNENDIKDFNDQDKLEILKEYENNSKKIKGREKKETFDSNIIKQDNIEIIQVDKHNSSKHIINLKDYDLNEVESDYKKICI